MLFDGLGIVKGWPLWASYRLNAGMKEDVAHIFENIAERRKELLLGWGDELWKQLDRLSAKLQAVKTAGEKDLEDTLLQGRKDNWQGILLDTYNKTADFTELFIIDTSGTVVVSTCSIHTDTRYSYTSLLGPGLQFALSPDTASAARKCLFGPYSDPLTLQLGPRSSSFHDAMTLMFMTPLIESGSCLGLLCGRVPNDCMGDLIQRESGHIYPDSGDNYLFMAQPVIQNLQPGTALSRSRFEDSTFSHGENLKDGVSTDWGQISVRQHTELELIFNDPATGGLHPGVAGTIRDGSHLFVEFPGYPDYRHIPVIGKGLTLQMPHCPDLWGMMCEGDLEEVYRLRSIAWKLSRTQLLFTLAGGLLSGGWVWLSASAGSSTAWLAGSTACFSLVFGVLFSGFFQRRESRRLAAGLRTINRFIRLNAEGTGDLTQRLDTGQFGRDELGELARWINNMNDSFEGIMLQVKLASFDVLNSQTELKENTTATADSTEAVSRRIREMTGSIKLQLNQLGTARQVTDSMRHVLQLLESQTEQQRTSASVAKQEVGRIGAKIQEVSRKVTEASDRIDSFTGTMKAISGILHVIEEISAETHLLALNASIEAARVGEQGRGFEVVALQIRKLADLTRRSTEDVRRVIGQVDADARQAQISIHEGVREVEEGGALIQAASEILNTTEISDAGQEQIVDEVIGLMESIGNISIDNGNISTEVEARVEQLMKDIVNVRHTHHNVEAITLHLATVVNQFKLREAADSAAQKNSA